MKLKKKLVPVFRASDFFSKKKKLKPAGWIGSPDCKGPMVVSRELFKKLTNVKKRGSV